MKQISYFFQHIQSPKRTTTTTTEQFLGLRLLCSSWSKNKRQLYLRGAEMMTVMTLQYKNVRIALLDW